MSRTVAFRPALQGPFASRFFGMIRHAVDVGDLTDARFAALVTKELKWVDSLDAANSWQQQRYRACWLILRDLHRIGWNVAWRSNTLYLCPPDHSSGDEISAQKQIVRNAMSHGRADRLRESADFIQRMESPPSKPANRAPIHTLLADGRKLGRELKRIAETVDRTSRSQELRKVVRPYLQLVREKARCEHTGHLLADIWRYFRLYWANPPEATPGRSLLYLIRDAAQPNHPVMGIFALENAPIRIACRDEYLGWTVESFKRELDGLESMRDIRDRIQGLLSSLDESVKDIDARGLCRPSEIRKPTPEVFDRLAEIAKLSDIERRRATQEWQSREDDEECDLERSDLGNISKDAEKALYRRKRAAQLSWLLFSKKELLALMGNAVKEFFSEKLG